jgi:hypothetical protein
MGAIGSTNLLYPRDSFAFLFLWRDTVAVCGGGDAWLLENFNGVPGYWRSSLSVRQAAAAALRKETPSLATRGRMYPRTAPVVREVRAVRVVPAVDRREAVVPREPRAVRPVPQEPVEEVLAVRQEVAE